MVDGVLQADIRRRFALVASRPGTVQIPEVQVPWWNVTSDQAELAKASGVALAVSPAPATDAGPTAVTIPRAQRSEEHTSELQSLMRISYAVFCLKKKKQKHKKEKQ